VHIKDMQVTFNDDYHIFTEIMTLNLVIFHYVQ